MLNMVYRHTQNDEYHRTQSGPANDHDHHRKMSKRITDDTGQRTIQGHKQVKYKCRYKHMALRQVGQTP